MAQEPLSAEKAIETLKYYRLTGSNKNQAAELAGVNRGTYRHRLAIAMRMLEKGEITEAEDIPGAEHSARLQLDIEDGQVLIASDAHYWPGEPSTMHRAFVRFIKDLKPRAVIMNGDVFDGARASRHAPIGWESRPTLKQELEACQLRLGEIEQAAGKARKIWTLGNHDSRFETRLAMQAPEFEGINGLDLKSHFPFWEPCWSVFINDNCVVKHRFRSGVHATWNNTIYAGRTIVTGHLHAAKVTPFRDYNGCRWGVDSGTLCEAPWIQAIDYLEDNPVQWHAAFVVLTFHKGRLLQPQLCLQHAPFECDFQGQVYRV